MDDSLYSEPLNRHQKLVTKLREKFAGHGLDVGMSAHFFEDLATGMLVRFWRIAQKYWVPSKELIPISVFRQEGLELLIDVGMAVRNRHGIYACGAKRQFAWLMSKSDNGKKGGRPRGVTKSGSKPKKSGDKATESDGKLPKALSPSPAPAPTPPQTQSPSPASCSDPAPASPSSSRSSTDPACAGSSDPNQDRDRDPAGEGGPLQRPEPIRDLDAARQRLIQSGIEPGMADKIVQLNSKLKERQEEAAREQGLAKL